MNGAAEEHYCRDPRRTGTGIGTDRYTVHDTVESLERRILRCAGHANVQAWWLQLTRVRRHCVLHRDHGSPARLIYGTTAKSVVHRRAYR